MAWTPGLPRIAALLALAVASAIEAAPHFARALEPITLDGKLDDPSWQSAVPTSRFFEVYPGNVAPPGLDTEARFLFDEQNIYIGVRAFDSNASAIRSNRTRRDQIAADQDHIEILLDPLNTGHTAIVLRTNPAGALTDGLFNADTGLRDLLPDFDFDARTSVDSAGWTAEFRIPLSTLRHETGPDQSWTVVIYRNVPREVSTTIASAPIPRGATCVLCYADKTAGISISELPSSLQLTPHVTYTRDSLSQRVQTGLDAKWQLRPDTAVDLTVAPDFSQVEADALQLMANTRFALLVTEKRPFFLEGSDLLSTPIRAIYTRAFADPKAGLRITHRNEASEYTALAIRDGAGPVIEPGATRSRTAMEDSESTAFVGRYRILGDTTTFAGTASLRDYDDGGTNVVLGFDANWSPSTADRIAGQILWSETQTANRPDVFDSWDGRRLSGAAAHLSWHHSADSWYGNVILHDYSEHFRSWNGFLTQVGASRMYLSGGLRFYPRTDYIARVSPLLSISDTSGAAGQRISRAISPGLEIEGYRDTILSLQWSPNSQDTTDAGLRSYSSWTATVSSTPARWMPKASVSLVMGQVLNYSTGEVGRGRTLEATMPLRFFDRLEIDTTYAYQSLESARRGRVLTEQALDINVIWHFSNRLYAQGLYQDVRLTTADDVGATASTVNTRRTSLLLSYQGNWQTRYFAGIRDTVTGREVFGKVSYVFFR